MTKKVSIAILGASGYTGAELIRILLQHPHADIRVLTGDSQAGKDMGDVYPHLRFKWLPSLVTLEQACFKDIRLVFCCLPHGTTQPIIAKLPEHLKVIDLSADFRLADPELYAKWYGHPHQAVRLQQEAAYGLTELVRSELKNTRLVANPGCYPTTVLLPLMPLLEAKLIQPGGIVIDAKSGVTGAGRAAKQANLFTELNDGISAYGIASHRHCPEIEQGLSYSADTPVTVTFTPHLMPMNRGMLSTLYVKLAGKHTADDLRRALKRQYDSEPFVHVLPPGVAPTTHQVRGTNDCVIGVFADRVPGQAIIVSVIDNLVKGASGQAVQNMNVMFGFPETTGLNLTAVFP
jgi:N-acetyl-gamma-glutamyl-phosphate reductase